VHASKTASTKGEDLVAFIAGTKKADNIRCDEIIFKKISFVLDRVFVC